MLVSGLVLPDSGNAGVAADRKHVWQKTYAGPDADIANGSDIKSVAWQKSKPEHLILSLSEAALPEAADENQANITGRRPDYEGLRKDCYYFLGYQFFVVGVLYISPQSVSGWTPEQKKKFTVQKYYNDITDIVWDNDKLYINYLLHPYWGMSYYIRARDRGLSQSGAFGYSFLLSTLWEFGVEAMFEKVSIQDLFITPIVGSVVGKYVDSYRDGIKRKPVKSGMDDVMLGITDPLGALNRWVEGNVGKEASVSFSYSVFQDSYTSIDRQAGISWNNYEQNFSYKFSPAIGITFRYRL